MHREERFAAGRVPRRIEEWQGVRALVVGLARSGLAAAQLLVRHGALVSGCDRRPATALFGIDTLRRLEIALHLGSDDATPVADADVLVISPGVPPDAAPVVEATRRGLPMISEVELAFQASSASWIGVTGTNGKSTTTALIGELLGRIGRRAWVAGNIGNALSDGIEEVPSDGIVVAEVSSFQLERTITFRPHVAVLLNLAPDHLDRYPNYEAYAAAKAHLFDHQTESDFAALNADDPEVMRLAAHGSARVLTFSRRAEVLTGAEAVDGRIHLVRHGHREPLIETERIRIPGPHNLENTLGALTALVALGHPSDGTERDLIVEGLESFAGLEHRLESCGEIEGRHFYNDSKSTNVASLRQALLSFPPPFTLIAGGRDKHGDFPGLVELAGERIDRVILIGEAADSIARAWARIPQRRAASLEEAVAIALDETPEGGVIILSPGCASYDMFRDFEDRGRKFKQAVEDERRRREGAAS